MQRSKEMHVKCTCWCSAKSRASSCASSTLLPMLTDASRTWHRLCLEKQNRYTHTKAPTQFKMHFYLKPGQSLEMLREWWSSISLHKLYFLQKPIINNPYTDASHCAHLANDVVLVVFLVQGQDGRNKSGNLFLQFIVGHQMTHWSHRLSHCQPQLEAKQIQRKVRIWGDRDDRD